MPFSTIFDIQGQDDPFSFQFAQLPGLDVPHPQEAQVARQRARQIQRRATASAIFEQTIGAVTREGLTRAGPRPVTGIFETPQELPEREPMQDLSTEFNLFLQQFLGNGNND